MRLPVALLVAAAALGALGLLPGCVSPTKTDAFRIPPTTLSSERYVAELGVVYYPWRRSLPTVRFADPVPFYDSWDADRMVRDANRLAAAHLSFVLVPIDLRSAQFPQDGPWYARFLHALNAADPAMRFIPVLIGTQDQATALHAFVAWASQLGGVPAQSGGVPTATMPPRNWLQEQGRPLILLAGGIQFSPYRHPRFAFRAADANASQGWLWPTHRRPQSHLLLAKSASTAWIYASWQDPDDPERWVLPRDRGVPLRNAIWKAAENRATRIVVDSWNNYAAGAVVEPNSADNEALYEHFKREGFWLKQMRVGESSANL